MVKIVISAGAVLLLGIVSLVLFQAREEHSFNNGEISQISQEQDSSLSGEGEKMRDKEMRPQLDITEQAKIVKVEEVTAPPIEFAPAFTLPRIDDQGGVISLADYRGEKPVIVDFFAPHCPNCRRNIVSQKDLYEKYKDQVEIIIIGIDPEPANTNYFAKNPVAMPVVYDASSQVLRDYGIRFTNTHALINKDGSLHNIVYDDLREDYINELLR